MSIDCRFQKKNKSSTGQRKEFNIDDQNNRQQTRIHKTFYA